MKNEDPNGMERPSLCGLGRVLASAGAAEPPQSAPADASLSNVLFPDLATAFQPIVDVTQGCRVFAHEALLRTRAGGAAGAVLCRVPGNDRYAFDHACRVRAIETAVRLGLPARLSLNVLPGGVCAPLHGVHGALGAALTAGFPLDRIIFEITEHEQALDHAGLLPTLAVCRAAGAFVALDDFGAGYAGLNALVEIRPDIIKLDTNLIREIDADRARQAVVGAAVQACRAMDIFPIAEGIETAEEARTLRAMGIELMQGFLFARPALERLPPVRTDAVAGADRE
jgi:EAL domain-containing protein (putative c-di-GMP-specific phosphodiesterase class I)